MPLPWRLTAPSWALLAELLAIERYPSPIEVRSAERTTQQRSQARNRARRDLETAGLLRAGRVDADLEHALRLLRRPALWVDSVWLPDAATDQPVRVIAARSGHGGVCATQHPSEPGATLLETIPATGLAAAVVARLPPQRPGGQPPVTLAVDNRPARDETGSVLVPADRHADNALRDRDTVATVLDHPHPRAGQIAANLRDTGGTTRRSPVLRWCDNEGDGRYQTTVYRHAGQQWLSVRPADPTSIGDGVQRLLASLTGR
ncbi:MAG: ESX secretion-associated protein EspG [Pseudonocardiaceae bacterium]